MNGLALGSWCCKQVRSDAGFHWHQCFSAGKVTRDGKLFCGIHDPVAVQARVDKQQAKWDAARAADRARYAEGEVRRARAALCVAACHGLPDGAVVKLAECSRVELLDLILAPRERFYFTGQGIPKV